MVQRENILENGKNKRLLVANNYKLFIAIQNFFQKRKKLHTS